MTLKTVLLAVAICMLAAVGGQAATLVPLAGDVYDRKGDQGFHPARTTTEVNAGDTVMAGPNGSAQIDFGGGCVINVAAGQTVTVPAQCQAATESNATQYLVAGAVAAVVGTGIYSVLKKDNNIPLPASP